MSWSFVHSSLQREWSNSIQSPRGQYCASCSIFLGGCVTVCYLLHFDCKDCMLCSIRLHLVRVGLPAFLLILCLCSWAEDLNTYRRSRGSCSFSHLDSSATFHRVPRTVLCPLGDTSHRAFCTGDAPYCPGR